MVDSVSGSVVTAGNRIFISGQGSGLDFTSLIQAAYDQKVRAADRIDLKIDNNLLKIDAFTNLNTLTQSVQNSVSNLKKSYDLFNPNVNAFYDRLASVSFSGTGDPLSFVDVAVEKGAQLGNYDIEVVAVGLTQKVISQGNIGEWDNGLNGISNKGTATFELGLDGGPTSTVSFTNATSLNQIISQINGATATTGVRASAVSLDGGTTYKLILEATESGKDFQYIDTDGNDGLFLLGIHNMVGGYKNEIQAHSDSHIRFEGVDIIQDSNSYDGIVPGLEFTVKKATAGEIVNIDVQNDAAAVKAEIEGFISAYNELRDFVILNQQVGTDGTVPEGAELFGENILKALSTGLQRLFSNSYTTSSGIETLAEIGIKLDSANKLYISSQSKLDDALLNNFQSVQELFETQTQFSSANLRLQSNKNTQISHDFQLQITHNGTQVTNVLVDGVGGQFTFSGNSIRGAAGTVYEGLTFAYNGTTNANIDVEINSGFADLFYTVADQYSNATSGSVIKEIARLAEKNIDLDNEASEIRDRALDFRDREIDRLARFEAEISRSQTLINQIRAILDAQNNDN